MSWFPQIGSGSVAQFPLQRSRRWRSIANELESSERILLPDTTAGEIDWKLSLQELSDPETAALSNFFVAAQGQARPFLFIDPLANLLGWSDDFTRPDWRKDLLTISSGFADPTGATSASTVTNPTAAVLALEQTLAVPGDYTACFSAWVWSSTAGHVTLTRDGVAKARPVGRVWSRVFISGRGVNGAVQSSFSVAMAPGQNIGLWGLQVEAQPYPSQYKRTAEALGIYEETYFGSDELKITSTGPGLSSCQFLLSSRT